MRSSAHSRSARWLLPVASVAAIVTAAACDGTDRSAGRFCSELADAKAVLDPAGVTPTNVGTVVRAYERLDGLTPPQVEREWHDLTELVRTAATVDLADSSAVQAAADRAYASQRSIEAVVTWAKETCAIDLPPAAAIPSSPTTSPPSTTP